MKYIHRYLLVLILSTSFANTFSQTLNLTDSIKTKFQSDCRNEDSILTERMNRYRKEFYSKPPFLTLNFEKNKEKIQLSDNFKFWFEVQTKRYDPKRVNVNQFLVDSISDSITVVFVYEKDSLKFKNIKYNWIKYGASLRFGIVENIEQIRSIYKKQKRNEDFDERTDIGQPYLRLLQDKNIKKYRRKIESIDFLALIPRTYGDGCNFDIVTIKAKKTPSP